MPIEIIVPRLGWSMEEGAFVAWLKKEGEFVRAGEPLFSIEGDKAVQEIESLDSGLLRIAVNCPKPGAPIRVGDLLGHLTLTDEVSGGLGGASDPYRSPGGPVAAGREARASIQTLSPSLDSAPGHDCNPKIVEAPAGGASTSPTWDSDTGSSEGRVPSMRTISPRALRIAAELGVDWTKIAGTGRTGRIRERDIRNALGAATATQSAFFGASAVSPAGPGSVVLVTGGCGFIGTWVLRELLQRGLGVVVLDAADRPARWKRVIGTGSERVRLVKGSLLDRSLLHGVFAEHRVTQVIHLAALLTPACQADPWEGCRVNVLGTVALFEEVRASVRPIEGLSYASSVAAFAEEADPARALPDEVNHPPTLYGALKKSVELIAAQYWQHFQVASVGIRPQVAYGPERDTGLTAGPSLAARAAARGEAFSIGFTGRVGYDYVEDVARAFVRAALETPRGAPIVDLPGGMADVQEIIAAIVSAAPGAAGTLSANGPSLPACAPSNPQAIRRLYLDWKTTPLTEGIRRTVEFYRREREIAAIAEVGLSP